MSAPGPRLPTCTLQQVVSYLRQTGHHASVVVSAAYDPKATSVRVFGPLPEGELRDTA